MFIAHLSDLHISRFGLRLTDVQNGRCQLAKGSGWFPIKTSDNWTLECRKAQGRVRLYDAYRLVDTQQRVHKTLKKRGSLTRRAALDELLRLQESRQRSSCEQLAANFPSFKKSLQMLQQDPENGNVRFCVLSHVLRTHKPDWLVITGDLTDDAEGYNLLSVGFEPFIQAGRLVCIPGNHDIYSTPALWNSQVFIKSTAEKRVLWKKFIQSIGLPVHGRLLRDLGEGVVLACFDSCYPSKIPYSASGLIPPAQLADLETQLAAFDPHALRLACMHHPLVLKPRKNLSLKTYLPGMRLRNAKNISSYLKNLHFKAVMTGHQHMGYRVQPASGPLALSAPSSVYGCRTGALPFYWLLDVTRAGIQSILSVPLLPLTSA